MRGIATYKGMKPTCQLQKENVTERVGEWGRREGWGWEEKAMAKIRKTEIKGEMKEILIHSLKKWRLTPLDN